MGGTTKAGFSIAWMMDHAPYIDEAGRETQGLIEEMQDASRGHHGPQTQILSRRELDRARDEDLLRIGLIGPMM